MKRRKLMLGALVAAMCLSILTACGSSGSAPVQPSNTEQPVASQEPVTSTDPAPSEEPAADGPDFVNYTTITTEGVLDFPLTFTLLPDGFNTYDNERKGTDEIIIRYTTDAYEDGVTYEKFCRVYLPYGYDPDDKETKYNVIYFQHGNMGNPNRLFDMRSSQAQVNNLFDNMFDPEHGVMEPCIIVCPTFYLEPDETKIAASVDALAGDGRCEGVPGNYYREVVEDLIPAVESQFNVYCTDFSEEGIKATRDHRAWAGYSRGSVCTWYMFHHDLEYFGYFMPMSAECMRENYDPNGGAGEKWTNEEAFLYIKETIDAHPELDFFIFAASGGAEDAPALRIQMAYFAKQTDTFSFGLDPEVNNFYYTCAEFSHSDVFFPFYLYNAKDVLFR